MRIRVLPLGFAYILLAAVVSAAAANTANNALYMISALMLGLFVVSGVLSILSLSRLEIGRVTAGEFHARSPALLYVEVLNRGRWPQAGVRLNGRECPALPGRSSRLVPLEAAYPRRGRHPWPPFRLESRFPFGFLSRRKDASKSGELLVYPALDLRGEPERSTRRRDEGHEERAARWGEVLDHRGLKPFSEGEDPRHIHWKKSAQRNQLVAVEYDRRSRGSLEMFLDTRQGDPDRFERDVEAVAGACERLLRRGSTVALTTPDRRFEPGSGEGHRRRLLGFLAVVEREA